MAAKGKRIEAIGYLRTSSATNVSEGKDSEARQRNAVESFANSAGYIIVDWFYDAAISGTACSTASTRTWCIGRFDQQVAGSLTPLSDLRAVPGLPMLMTSTAIQRVKGVAVRSTT
jgi:hypothetical protein